jgi:dienelactone hydrolase
MKQLFFICAAILFVFFIWSCSAIKSQSTERTVAVDFSLPRPTGNFAVGRQLTFLSNNTSSNSENPREIAAWIYYPAEASKKTSEEQILPEKWAERYRISFEKRLGKSAADALLSLKTAAKTDAEPESSKNSFPVLIFAPGANWLPTDYSAIIEDLASHGYVVIAFASSPLSPVIQFSGGKIVDSPRVSEETYGIVSGDFRFIANRIERLNQDSSLKIKNRLDLKNIGAFGHSIGGAAAVSAATNNPKIIAAANLDGDYSGETINAQPGQSILYISTEPPDIAGAPIEKWDEERNEIRRKGIWEKISQKSKAAFRVRTAKMFHSNFQDAAMLPPVSIPENLRANRYGTIEGERGVRLINELVRAFFDSQLRAKPIDDFIKIEKKYSEIRIENKTK